MFENLLTGRVWVFGDNISTDLIMPGLILGQPDLSPAEAAKHCMSSNRPGWAEQVRSGDIVLAGVNFGCGSSRPASRILQTLGIQVVIAESLSRIFFRNSINLGFPAIVCPGILNIFGEGDTAEADICTGIIRNITTNRAIRGEAMPENSPPLDILQAGGIISYLEARRKMKWTLSLKTAGSSFPKSEW